MKPIVWLLLSSCLTGLLHAQTPILTITTDKTTSLVFPFPVRHVDRGTADVLVQPLTHTQNILLIKAACAQFAETSLSVVTEDGSLYSFLVRYDKAPFPLHHELPARGNLPPASYAALIRNTPAASRGVRDHAWGMSATLSGIYIQGKTMYYQLRLDNKSPLDYPIDFLRFSVRDLRKAKRTAVQERELPPLHLSGNTSEVRAFSTETLVVALPSLTPSDGKYLAIEVGEKNGGRHLELKVRNRRLLRAMPLPDALVGDTGPAAPTR